MTSTPDLIAHLVELREKATPGEWGVGQAFPGAVWIYGRIKGVVSKVAEITITHREQDDAAFIVALVNAFPALAARLAEVEGVAELQRGYVHDALDKGHVFLARAEAAESLNTTLQERFDTHTKAVGEFLGDLYMIMVDPCAEDETKVAEVKEQLLVAAIAQREAISLNTTLARRLKEAEEALAVVRQSLIDQALARLDPAIPLLTEAVIEALRGDAEASHALAKTREERVRAHGLSILLDWQDKVRAALKEPKT